MLKNNFNIPILLIAWRRPEKTLKIIEKIKEIKASKVYLACDGFDQNNSKYLKNILDTRRILVEKIDWSCKKKYFFSNLNQGCKYGVSNAINWFFKNENSGIILEDDCLPHLDFFSFCEELLERYQNDDRIWSITGQNMQKGKIYGEHSYYFSKYSHCWGWATWKRCWVKYDAEIKSWPKYKNNKILNELFDNKKEISYWTKIFDNLYYHSKPDTWDYQWTYTCLINSGLTIIPNKNLIENIGFDEEATHTFDDFYNSKISNFDRLSSGLIPLNHPENIIRYSQADKFTEKICYSGELPFTPLGSQLFFKKLINKLKKIITKILS